MTWDPSYWDGGGIVIVLFVLVQLIWAGAVVWQRARDRWAARKRD